MTNEQIKKLLYEYPKLRQWIADYETDLENIREQLDKHYSVNASIISDMPRGTDVSDKTFNAVERIDKLKTVYIEQVDYVANKLKKLYNDKQTVEKVLPELNPTQQFIVEKRYFARLNWDDVTSLDSQKREKNMLWKEHGRMFGVIKDILKEGD